MTSKVFCGWRSDHDPKGVSLACSPVVQDLKEKIGKRNKQMRNLKREMEIKWK